MATGSRQTLLRHLHRMIGGRVDADVSDRQLLERFCAGHEDGAFATLVQRHASLVWGVCWRVLRQTQDAEDVFQATFLVLARKAARIGWQESVGSWLYQVAYRLALKARTGAARRAAREKRAAAPAVDLAAACQELGALLDQELHRLPDRYRAPLLLCYLDGKTRDEAAQQLGWTLATVKRRLEAGRELLRTRLARQGLAFSTSLLAVGLTSTACPAAVPAGLADATVPSALAFATGMAPSVSAAALVLAKTTLRTTLPAWLKFVTAVLLAVGLVGGGTALLLPAPLPGGAEDVPRLETADAADDEPPVDRDAIGDPLPPDARARIGSLRLRHARRIATLAFSPDARVLASGSEDRTVRLWQLADGKELAQLQGHSEGVRALAFSRDGRRLATGGYDGSVCIWDTATGRELRRLSIGYNVCALAFAPNGRTLAVGGSFEQRLCLHDIAGQQAPRSLGTDLDLVVAVAFSPDGKLLASGGGQDRTVRFWNVAAGREHLPKVDGLGGLIAGLNSDRFEVRQQAAIRLEALGALAGPALRQVLTTRPTLEVRQRVDRLLEKLDRPAERAWTLAFSPDGQRLAAGGKDGSLWLWNPVAGTQLGHWKGHAAEIWTVGFAPDGKVLASGGADRTLRFWDVASHRELRSLPLERGEVTAVAFAPDGQVVAAGGQDGTIQLGDLTRSRPLDSGE